MEELAGRYGSYARCLASTCESRVDLAPLTEEQCPLCGAQMRDKGKFLSCSRFPDCKGSHDKAALARARKSGKTCPSCGHLLVEKRSTRGKFLGCSAFPQCRYTEARSTGTRGEKHPHPA